MIIELSRLMVLPLLILVWAIDAYLFLAVVHVTVGCRVTLPELSDWQRSLRTLVEPLPTSVAMRLSGWRDGLPEWLAWAVTVTGLLVVRLTCRVVVIAVWA